MIDVLFVLLPASLIPASYVALAAINWLTTLPTTIPCGDLWVRAGRRQWPILVRDALTRSRCRFPGPPCTWRRSQRSHTPPASPSPPPWEIRGSLATRSASVKVHRPRHLEGQEVWLDTVCRTRSTPAGFLGWAVVMIDIARDSVVEG